MESAQARHQDAKARVVSGHFAKVLRLSSLSLKDR